MKNNRFIFVWCGCLGLHTQYIQVLTLRWFPWNEVQWIDAAIYKRNGFLWVGLRELVVTQSLDYVCFSLSPNLTWRDVQHVIVNSARSAPGIPGGTEVPLKRGHWIQNKSGFYVSKFYGFGLMDAAKMMSLAKDWKPVPTQLRCEIKGSDENK